ncbi:MAG: hypothetical protein BWY76_02701 [bacterium ADurb.Bin429]|nr:MAG: hypothetical protein BWY76_02701 [bacterium ADurb.Bin429]
MTRDCSEGPAMLMAGLSATMKDFPSQTTKFMRTITRVTSAIGFTHLPRGTDGDVQFPGVPDIRRHILHALAVGAPPSAGALGGDYRRVIHLLRMVGLAFFTVARGEWAGGLLRRSWARAFSARQENAPGHIHHRKCAHPRDLQICRLLSGKLEYDLDDRESGNRHCISTANSRCASGAADRHQFLHVPFDELYH